MRRKQYDTCTPTKVITNQKLFLEKVTKIFLDARFLILAQGLFSYSKKKNLAARKKMCHCIEIYFLAPENISVEDITVVASKRFKVAIHERPSHVSLAPLLQERNSEFEKSSPLVWRSGHAV